MKDTTSATMTWKFKKKNVNKKIKIIINKHWNKILT